MSGLGLTHPCRDQPVAPTCSEFSDTIFPRAGYRSAVGGTVQVLKTLWEFYSQHKRNKAVLEILESFSHNLEIVRLILAVRVPV